MTDYTKLTDFSAKDDLPAGAAEKDILGSEWDDELAAISTAIASKYDSADLSDQSTAEAGASNAVLVTPLRTVQAAQALQPGPVRQSIYHGEYYVATAQQSLASAVVTDNPHLQATLLPNTVYEVTALVLTGPTGTPQIVLDVTQTPQVFAMQLIKKSVQDRETVTEGSFHSDEGTGDLMVYRGLIKTHATLSSVLKVQLYAASAPTAVTIEIGSLLLVRARA